MNKSEILEKIGLILLLSSAVIICLGSLHDTGNGKYSERVLYEKYENNWARCAEYKENESYSIACKQDLGIYIWESQEEYYSRNTRSFSNFPFIVLIWLIFCSPLLLFGGLCIFLSIKYQ